MQHPEHSQQAASVSVSSVSVTPYVKFTGKADPLDLVTLLSRARAVDPQAAVHLVGRGKVLGAYVAALSPATLLDMMPTVLGLRAMSLAEEAQINAVVDAGAVLDRLARIEDAGLRLAMPPVTVSAAWAGIAPPVSGWELVSGVRAEDLRRAAKAGMDAVDKALPANPGHAVVDTVRSRIWASPLEGLEELTVPSGCAFAAEVLGFLPSKFEGEIPVYTHQGWVRLNAPGGFVLARV
ncbi:hypothetical protein [Rothia sp. ZJ1223]|uniref:hypothetical protein n=1 Tax=Rothia sp. ZJ1223 TaxID=2811098 RepID=UPI00195DF5DF|nr:hypothetical protein [Rothia sp. ZJ1223]MBM7050873.1 hypothetical protein [Rothia sp. ZJ1223]